MNVIEDFDKYEFNIYYVGVNFFGEFGSLV